MQIELNQEFKECEPRLFNLLVNALVQFQVDVLLNHLENDSDDYKKRVLKLTDENIRMYENVPFDYIRNHKNMFLSAAYEAEQHLEYLNDYVLLPFPITDFKVSTEMHDYIDQETYVDIKEYLGLVD